MIRLRKLTLIANLVLASFFMPGTSDLQAAANGYCGPPDALFAHCKAQKPVFKAVLLTIHGWKGSCQTTFGDDRQEKGGALTSGSLYSLFKDMRWFDFDCLDYDSVTFPIENHVKRLKDRISALRGKGYEDLIMVTHSTGGIIALQYLVERLKTAIDSQNFDVPSLPLIMNWSAPINGLRWQIKKAGGWLNFIGSTQETLPQLDDENNPFLGNLRSRLSIYQTLKKKVPVEHRQAFDTHAIFFHGNATDWVVRGIDPADARSKKWLWEKPAGRFVYTDQAHVKNINNPGNPEAHRYPGHVTESESVISIPLKLQLEKIFPASTSDFDKTLVPHQLTMLNGIVYNSQRLRHENPQHVEALLSFLRRLLLERFPRSKEVDYKLLKHLTSEIFSETLVKTSGSTREATIHFVRKVLREYDATISRSETSPGHGEPGFVNGVLEFAKTLDRALGPIIVFSTIPSTTTMGWPSIVAAGDSETEAARADLVTLMLNNLSSSYATIRGNALKLLKERAPTFSRSIIRKANLIERLEKFYTPLASSLGTTPKESLGGILTGLATRSGAIGAEVSEMLNRKVIYRSKKVPLWKSLQSVRIDKIFRERVNHRFLSLNDIGQGIKTLQPGQPRTLKQKLMVQQHAEWTKTLGAMTAEFGSWGNGKVEARASSYTGDRIYSALPQNYQISVQQAVKEFAGKKSASKYPTLWRQIDPRKWGTQ